MHWSLFSLLILVCANLITGNKLKHDFQCRLSELPGNTAWLGPLAPQPFEHGSG